MALEFGQGGLKLGRFAGVESIGDQECDGAPPHQPTRVVAQQAVQRRAPTCAAGEIGDTLGGVGQHAVGVGLAKGPGEVRERRADGKHVAPPRIARSSMQEGHQQSRVAFHRPRHIDQHQQGQRLFPAAAARHAQHLPFQPRSLAQGTGPVRLAAPSAGPRASARVLWQHAMDITGPALHLAVFPGVEGAEIGLLKALALTGAEAGIGRRLVLGRVSRVVRGGLRSQQRRKQGIKGALRGLCFVLCGRRGQSARHGRQPWHSRSLKIAVEEFAKHGEIALAADQHRLERGRHLVTARQIHPAHRLQRQRNARAVHRNTGPPQGPPKTQQVVGHRHGAGLQAGCNTDEAARVNVSMSSRCL